MTRCDILHTIRPVRLTDKPTFDRYLTAYPPAISELTFTNAFCWADIRHYMWCEHEDHLIVSFRDAKGRLSMFPPVGPNPAKVMLGSFHGLSGFRWVGITEHLAHTVQSGRRLVLDRANSDYVYDLGELKSLAGKQFDGKRNFVRRLEKLSPVVSPLTAADAGECMFIQERWLEGQKKNPSARDEGTAINNVLMHWDALGVHGIGVRVEGVLVGFAIGEPLNPRTFVEHFEKALTGYQGVYQYLLHQFALSIPAPHEFLNREQDLGIPGIRKAKESWNPAYQVGKFTMRVSSGR